MKNPILEFFKNIDDDTLIQCIIDLQSEDGSVKMDSEFRKVMESVRNITNSTTVSTDFLMCQMNVYHQASLRFVKLKTNKNG